MDELIVKKSALKDELRALRRKIDTVYKNNKYKDNEAFRESRKQKSLEYYYKVKKPQMTATVITA